MKHSLYGVDLYVTTTADSVAETTEGVAVSSTNTYYSQPFSSPYAAGFSVRLAWTGTPAGTFTLWFSNKENPDRTSDSDWNQDTSFVPTNPAGSAGSMGDGGIGNAHARLWRIKYVNASGSGTLTGQAHVNRA